MTCPGPIQTAGQTAGQTATQSTAPGTVVIVENESSIRESLEFLLTSANYRCNSFASGEAFLAASLPQPPCCLLLDLQLGGVSGLEVQNELNAQPEHPPVLFLSGDDSIARAVSAMRAGAIDFLQKPFDPELLLNRVEHALQASADGHGSRGTGQHDAALLADLTPREHEILALLVDGETNKAIARILGISIRTVETHRKHIMDKLEARTLADLVRMWLNGEGTMHAPRQ